MMRDIGIQHLKGFGAVAVDAVSEKVRVWRLKHPVAEKDLPKVELINGWADPVQWHAGEIAAADGRHADEANPNPVDSFAWRSWNAGWANAFLKSQPLGPSAEASPAVSVELMPEPVVEQPASPPTSVEQPVAEQPEIEPPAKQTRSAKPKKVKAKKTEPATVPASSPTSPAAATTEAKPAVALPDDSDIDATDPDSIAAYRAGCEAALEDKPVTANPHKRSSRLWEAFDKGWQDTWQPNDADELE